MVIKSLANCLMLLGLFAIGCGADQGATDVVDIEALKLEFQTALPVGSTRAAVEAYLTEQGLDYSYVEQERTFYAIRPDIGRYRLIYSTSLLIRAQMDDDDRLLRTDFELEHTGP